MASDQGLFNDPRAQPMVTTFDMNRIASYDPFVTSTLKMGRQGMLIGAHGVRRKQCWNDFERIESNGVPGAAEEEHIKEPTYLKLELRNILSTSKILKTSSAYLLCEKVPEALCSSPWLVITKEQPSWLR